jgi:ferredoxin-NADP reductase
MTVRATEKSRGLIELPLVLFLRIADGDGQLTAREMERFDALLADPSWCRSELLRRSLPKTAAEKPALWKQYAAGQLRTGIDHVSASLDTLLNGTPADQRADLERDLCHFCDQLLRSAHGAAGLFGRDRAAGQAHRELTELINRPSARVAAAPVAVSSDRPALDTPPVERLLLDEPTVDSFWSRGKLPLVCTGTEQETHDVTTFHFSAQVPKLFRYRPGQFITFELPIDGKVVRRSYTLSSSPSRPFGLAVTIKRVPGGLVSNWMHDHMRAGTSVFAEGPSGRFTCLDGSSGPCLFISGGSGITPVMSMARWLCDTSPRTDMRFLHFARSPADLIFAGELGWLQARHRSFQPEFVCSSGTDGWTGRVGRISGDLLREAVPDLHARRVYLCGPVPFMEAARAALEGLGFDMSRFAQESFGGVPREAKPTDPASVRQTEIVFRASQLERPSPSTDYLLDVALQAGIDIGYSCRAGQCGSCKVTLLEGEVEQDCTDGLSADDVENGVVLACQARPMGRVVLDL